MAAVMSISQSAPERHVDGWMLALFDGVDDAVFIHDHAGNILEANASCCRRLGYTHEEMLRLTTAAIDDPTFADGFDSRLHQQTKRGQLRCLGRHRTKDGRIVAADISTEVIQFNGKPAVLAFLRDVIGGESTEIALREQNEQLQLTLDDLTADRRRVEKALRESEAFYHALVSSLPQNIYRKDHEGRITFANKHYCATLNKTLDELIGKTDFDLFPAHLAAKYVEDDKKVMESDKVFDAVEEHQTPGGAKLYVQVLKCPVWDKQGKAIGTQGVFWDVTERKRAEEMIARSERRYRQLTEAMQDGIVVAGQDGRITLFNPAAERLFGYRADDIVGNRLDRLLPLERRTKLRQAFRRFLETHEWDLIGRPVELEGRRRDGTTFPVEVALSAVDVFGSDDGSIQLVASVRDLTERYRIRAVLVQNEKLASIGLLSAGVAHEINNPLAFVANNLVVLERDSKGLLHVLDLHEQQLPRLAELVPQEVAKIKEAAEEIDLAYIRDNVGRLLARTREGVDRVNRIVRSLRGLARTDNPKRQDADLPSIIDSSLDILRGRLKRESVEAVINYDPNSTVMCVQTQISQVLLNLLVNAQQAIEAAGRTEGGRITVTTRRLAQEMLIEVADNGTGIDPVHLHKLFDPFFTTKEVGEGTGLGLSIAHNIVRAHGGRIEVDSQLGVGSAFRVYLPLETPRDVT